MKNTQLNLYVPADLGERIDKLIESYNDSVLVGKIRSRGEFITTLVSMVEAYENKNGEISSFFNLQ